MNDLISQMNPKRSVNDIDINKKSEKKEEKLKSTVKETTFNYYKILGVEQTATQLEIKRAFQSKLKKLHPDKVAQDKDTKAKYKLVIEAGDVLTDPLQRKAYDMQLKTDETTKDYLSQKDSFKEFIKLQEQNINEDNKKIAKLSFERGLQELDKKHGYIDKETKALSKDEYKRKMEDLELQREQEDLELKPENMFKGKNFTQDEFNKLFMKQKQKSEKRSSKSKTKDGIVKATNDLLAFNDYDDTSGGVSLDKYDSLYSEDKLEYGDNYSRVGAGMIGIDENDEDEKDDISLDSPTDQEDQDQEDKGKSKVSLDDAMKKLMAERNQQDDVFKGYDTKDYGSAMDDKYGVSSQLGFLVGNNSLVGGHQKNFKKHNVKEETLKAYKELTE